MKKVVIGLFLIAFAFNVNAQEDTKKDDFNKWQVRLRLITIAPNESATIETIGGDIDISTAVVPELDFTYFFTKNWSAELILGTAKHDVKAVSTAAGDIELGDVWILPPTLTLQYHFLTEDGFRPYLGAGLNYTLFYSADEGPTADDVSYDNSVAFAFQAGLDYDLNEKWFLNVDAKYLTLSTDATVDATTALGATVGADVDINPLIIGVGIGMRF
ncbi:outer membrane protein, OmpW family [Psychroflexus torquis ATCC 700755]|uniref:Outer membrane protein, OmpW family n=1 Tax=Psychroflexus torquis (strain ATCC 700755 / CIP 106069 / ACAM 623) TaxID=313595 RepID=K4IUU8_PSYTT|nr:OmpW family outer membrane protein [Psychroflexus torquis]AFU69250.1 outer membrane protein, OmpW family [Psychroflexus torquis ATCC 700755]